MTIRTTYVFAAFLALAAATGCSSMESDYCDARCDCERCSDHEYEECMIDAEANLDIASTYGCDPEAEDLNICVVEKYRCVGDNFDGALIDCARDYSDLAECIDHGSSL